MESRAWGEGLHMNQQITHRHIVLFTLLSIFLTLTAVFTAAAQSTYPQEADGSRIENISAKWLTRDTIDNGNAALLYLKPPADSEQSMRLQISYALSGEMDYNPGDVTITIPAAIFHGRDENFLGVLTIPFGKEPSTTGDFNWKKVGDNYILTNTKRMSAATKGYIEFQISKITPHLIQDSAISDEFTASIEVVTHQGNIIGLTSNPLTVQIDTEARLSNVTKSNGTPQKVPASEIPQAQRISGEDYYVLVNWTVYGYINSNTLYNVTVADTITNAYNGFIIDPDGTSTTRTLTQTQSNRYGNRVSFSFQTAYPYSQFRQDVLYTFPNNVEMTVTEVDPEIGIDPQHSTSESTSKNATFIERTPVWKEPVGNFNTWKYSYGSYPTELNQLREGVNGIDLNYSIHTRGYMLPWNGQVSGHTLLDEPTKSVVLTTTDTKVKVYRYRELVPEQDFFYKSIDFRSKPTIWKGVQEEHTISYTTDADNSKIPVIRLEILRNGVWTAYADVDYTSGSAVITPLTDGITDGIVDGSVIFLPEYTESFRAIVETNVAGFDYWMYPTIYLKNTDEIKPFVEMLFEQSPRPWTDVDNFIQMTVDQDGENLLIIGENDSKSGRDRIYGYTDEVAVYAEKKSNVIYVNYDKRYLTIHYSGYVHEQSFIEDRPTYNELVKEGFLKQETGGVWYDLLPPGVTPLVNSVNIGSGQILGVDSIPNYRGSGRTLLKVKVKHTPSPRSEYSVYNPGKYYYADQLSISFSAMYDFDSMRDYGDNIHNVIAFESDNPNIGTVPNYSGEPDDPYAGNHVQTSAAFRNNNERNLMSNLDPDRDDPSFVYAGDYTICDILSTARTSLSKDVQTNYDGLWSSGVFWGDESNARRVYTGGYYSYRLRMMSDEETKTQDLIFYDSLDNFVASQGNDEIDINAPRWNGIFHGLDVSGLLAKGIAPVIYYSTIPNLQLFDPNDPDEGYLVNLNLNNSAIWVKADDYTGSLADVKAIAVDASLKANGEKFTLEPLESASVYINMLAPQPEEAEAYIAQNANAYNNAAIICTSIDAETGRRDEGNFVRKDYTKVGLQPYTLTVQKNWSDDYNRDGIRPLSITVRLYANGAPTDKTFTITDNQMIEVSGIAYADEQGQRITYSFVEDPVPDGYSDTYIKNDTNFRITNTHEPERISVSGTKTWNNEDDPNPPESITVNLYANGIKTLSQTVTANEDGEWSFTFDNLYRYQNGNEIVYTIDEEAFSESYIIEIDGYDITNTYHPYGDLQISKEVLDATAACDGQEFTLLIYFFEEEALETIVTDQFDYTIYDASGAESGSGQVSSGGGIPLKDGETAVIKDISEYLWYSITEEDLPGYSMTGAIGDTGQIEPNKTKYASFQNTYYSHADINIPVSKRVHNIPLRRNAFTFFMYDEDNNQIRAAFSGSPSNSVTRPNGTTEYSEGTVYFGALDFTNLDDGKTFTYTIREVNNGFGGYTYDSTVYTVKITPHDDGKGNLTLETVFTKDDQPVQTIHFENVYEAEGEYTMKAWKIMGGREAEAGEFQFTLSDESGILQTKTNDENGQVTFDPIHFDHTDIDQTYTYTIREVPGSDPDIIYDEVTVGGYKVTVSDKGNGELGFTSEPIPDGQLPIFTNSLKDGALTVQKEIENGDPDQDFVFKARFIGNDYAPSATASYEEIIPEEALVRIGKVSVHILKYHYDYSASSLVYFANGEFIVQNTMNGISVPGSQLSSTNAWEVYHYIASLESSFEETEYLSKDGRKFYKTGGTLYINQKPYQIYLDIKQWDDLPGPNYSEIDRDREVDFYVQFDPDYVFPYYDGSYTVIRAEETISYTRDVDLTPAGNGEYSFTLKPGELVHFDNIPAGTSYQVYEELPEGWILVSQINESGTITPNNTSESTFTNRYDRTKATVTLTGSKTLDGTAADADAFSFELWEGNTLLETVPVKAGGMIQFSTITYEQAGTHTYTIKEVQNCASNLTCDTNEVTVVVSVSNNNGVLSADVAYTPPAEGILFENRTKPGSLTITKTGSPDWHSYEEDEFTFEITFEQPNGLPMEDMEISWTLDGVSQTPVSTVNGVMTVKCKAGQTIEITDLPAGTLYIVDEINPPEGWTVSSINQGSGVIESGAAAAVTAENVYTAEGYIYLHAYKKAIGIDLTEGLFTFDLYEDGVIIDTKVNGPVDINATIPGDNDEEIPNPYYGLAPVTFTMLPYTEPGVHTYEIRERQPEDEKIVIDGHPETVTVTVTDAGNGHLNAIAEYSGSQIFTNRKTFDLTVSKSVTGNLASRNRYFLFTAELSDVPEDGDYTIEYSGTGSAALEDTPYNKFNGASNPEVITVSGGQGTAEIWLRHDGTADIRGIPAGSIYTISENSAGHTALIRLTEGEAVLDPIDNTTTSERSLTADTEVAFTNEKSESPATGIRDSIIPALWILAFTVPLVALTGRRKIRNKK